MIFDIFYSIIIIFIKIYIYNKDLENLSLCIWSSKRITLNEHNVAGEIQNSVIYVLSDTLCIIGTIYARPFRRGFPSVHTPPRS